MAGSVHDQLHWKITVWEINVDITLPNCLEQEVPGQWTLDWWRDNSGFWQAAALWVIQAPLFIWLRVIRQPSDCPPASSHNWTIDVHNLTRELQKNKATEKQKLLCVQRVWMNTSRRSCQQLLLHQVGSEGLLTYTFPYLAWTIKKKKKKDYFALRINRIILK